MRVKQELVDNDNKGYINPEKTLLIQIAMQSSRQQVVAVLSSRESLAKRLEGGNSY